MEGGFVTYARNGVDFATEDSMNAAVKFTYRCVSVAKLVGCSITVSTAVPCVDIRGSGV